MADQSRTFDQLITLFADNTSGAISEQDIRDLVTSIFQYGGLHLHIGDTPAGQTIGTTFTKLTQFQEDLDSSVCITPAHASDQMTVVKGGVFLCLISFSFTGTNNSDWIGSVFVDDIDAGVCHFEEGLGSSGSVANAAAMDIITILDGEVLTYYLKSDGAGKTFTLQNGTFILVRIG